MPGTQAGTGCEPDGFGPRWAVFARVSCAARHPHTMKSQLEASVLRTPQRAHPEAPGALVPGTKEDSDDGFGDFDGGPPPAHGPSAQSLSPRHCQSGRPPSSLEHCLAERLSLKALSTELGPWGFLGGFKVLRFLRIHQNSRYIYFRDLPKHSEKFHIVALLSTAVAHFQHHGAYLK